MTLIASAFSMMTSASFPGVSEPTLPSRWLTLAPPRVATSTICFTVMSGGTLFSRLRSRWKISIRWSKKAVRIYLRMSPRSCARQRVDVLDVGHAMLPPRAAAVLGAEDLTTAAHAVDLVGVAGMERDRHHRALGLHAVVEPRPRPAEVLAAVERTVLAARGRAQARVERAWILRRHADVAPVGQGGEAPDLHVAPALAAVVA